MAFSTMKLSSRFYSIFAIIVVAIITVAVYALMAISDLAATTQKLYKHPFTVSVGITAIEGNLVRMFRASDKIILAPNADEIAAQAQELERLDKLVDADIALVKERFLGDKALGESLQRNFGEWRGIREKMIGAKKGGNAEEAYKISSTQGVPKRNEIMKDVQGIREFSLAKAKSFDASATASAGQALTTLLILSAAALLVVGGAVWWLLHNLLRQLGGEPGYATMIAGNIAGGDLAAEIQTKPQDQESVIFAMKTMRDSLSNIVNQVRGSTDTIATAAQEVANGNMDLSARTESQASSLE